MLPRGRGGDDPGVYGRVVVAVKGIFFLSVSGEAEVGAYGLAILVLNPDDQCPPLIEFAHRLTRIFDSEAMIMLSPGFPRYQPTVHDVGT